MLVGSGMEPSYGDQEEQSENIQGGSTVGFSAVNDPFTGDRWTNDEMSEGIGGQERGERTPEQQAEDLLRQAENLEPDYDNYDFESAEGGNGSPPLESQGHSAEQIRATDFGTEFEYMGEGTRDVQGVSAQVSAPGCTGRNRAMDPGWTGSERSFVGGQAATGSGNVPGCTGDDVSGRVLYAEPGQVFRAGLNGYQGGSGGQIFDRHTGMWNGLGEQLDCRRGVQSEGRDAQSVDPGRVEMLEALVAQLLRRDAASSADESCHERVDFVHSSSAVTAGRGSFKEGRGSCKTGEPKHRLGKGIGDPYGVRVNPNLRVFQPPWTSFQQEPDAVMSARPTTSGPGDDLLAATRAMQNVTLQEIPELKPYGAVECYSAVPTKLAHGSACQPASVGEGPEVRQAEVGSRPGVKNSGSGNGITGEVTVIVNGVPRIGRFNERGEVVLIPEAPKYFAMHEAGHQVRQATNVAAEEDRGSRDSKPNPFRSDAVSPFRTPTQECGPSASGSPPPPPPPGTQSFCHFLLAPFPPFLSSCTNCTF